MSSVLTDNLFDECISGGSGARSTSFLPRATSALAVAIGFSIPVSTSLAEIVTSLFMLSWCLEGNLRFRVRQLADNPAARLSLGMFALLFVAMTWSSASWYEAARCLLKYREFLYLPLLIPVFRQQPRLKSLAMHGFTLGATSMLLLSYFEWLSGIDVGLASSPNDYVIAKDRIIHSLLMALLVYFSAQQLVEKESTRTGKWIHAAIIALAAPNILFLVQGRTGYVLLGLLTILFMGQQFGRRGLVVAGLLVALAAGGAYSTSATVRARVAQTVLQLKNQFGWSTEKVWDPRLEYYSNTIGLIGRHPLLGTGTGSFSREYAALAQSRGLAPTTDPHNEYLHLAAQAGLPAASLFIAMLVLQCLWAGRLSAYDARIARGVAVAIAIGSLFNSLILSITGGLVWSYFSAIAMSDWERAAAEPAKVDETAVTRQTNAASVSRAA